MNILLFLSVFLAAIIFKVKVAYADEPAHEGLNPNDLAPAMKTKILDKLIDVTNERNFVRNELKRRGQVKKVGNEYEVKYLTAKSEGFGSRSYNEAFQKAGQSKYENGKDTVRHLFGRVQIWGADVDFTNAGYKAVVNAVTKEIENYGDAYGTNMTRIMCWDGGETPLCVVATATGDAGVVTVTLAAGSTTKWLRVGMPIEFMESDVTLGYKAITEAGAQDQTIANILGDTQFTFVATSHATQSVIADTTALVAAIKDAGVFRNGTFKKDPYGLWSLFGKMNNKIGDIDRALSKNWWARPNVYKKSTTGNGIEKGERGGTPLDWNLANLRKFQNVLINQSGAKKSDTVFFSTSDVGDYYIELWANRGGYHEEGPKVDAWPYRKIYFDGIPWLVDDYFMDNVIFGGDFSQMVQYLCREMHWEDRSGSIWHWVRPYDCWEAFTVERVNYGGLDYTKTGALWDLKGYTEMGTGGS